jgi:putative DNA primase/helicase
MKTTALEELGKFNDYNAHTEITMSAGSKDFLMAFKGKLIVEFSEGETLSRSETKQLKSIITTRYDNYREPYGRKSKDHPRQCVFAMTTNEDNYLKDDTGNRRWLPVKVMSEVCDIKWIKNNREQLYAEAHHRVMELKETTWEFPKELLEQAQDDRRVEDTNADLVLAWYKGLYQTQRDNGITVRDAFNGAIRSLETFKSFDKLEEMRIGGVLKGFLKLQKERTGTGTNRNTKWYDRRKLHEVSEEKKKQELLEQQDYADIEETKTYQHK